MTVCVFSYAGTVDGRLRHRPVRSCPIPERLVAAFDAEVAEAVATRVEAGADSAQRDHSRPAPGGSDVVADGERPRWSTRPPPSVCARRTAPQGPMTQIGQK